MKKIFIIALPFIAFATQAQSLRDCFQKATPQHLAVIKDSLSDAYEDFWFVKADTGRAIGGDVYAKNFKADGYDVSIQYGKGGIMLTGSYDALFPFWKKHINANADAKRIKFTGDRVRVQNLSFYESNGSWFIRSY